MKDEERSATPFHFLMHGRDICVLRPEYVLMGVCVTIRVIFKKS